MRMIVPYEKEITFNTKIAQISSISLEYEANVLGSDLSGDFIVSGEYKIHEVSVNKEPFKYRLPFNISLDDDLIRDSLKYDIYNFTYEVKDEDTLKVNIEFLLEGEVVEKMPQPEVKVEETKPESEKEEKETPEERDINVANNELDALLNQIDIKEKEADKKVEITNNIDIKDNKVDTKVDNSKNEEMILNNALNASNTYVTYHIHVVGENDTIDSITNNYKISKEVLGEYNDLSNLNIGDKILIPELQDE